MRPRNIRDKMVASSVSTDVHTAATHWSYTMLHNNNLPELHEYDASRKVMMNTPITLQR